MEVEFVKKKSHERGRETGHDCFLNNRERQRKFDVNGFEALVEYEPFKKEKKEGHPPEKMSPLLPLSLNSSPSSRSLSRTFPLPPPPLSVRAKRRALNFIFK